ncbi:MAG: Abi family protein [Magnetococcales bacterium]|nr:Abi family protein [Magnetococcales bacterium]
MTKPFDKPFLTIDQQLRRLTSRGMEIGDRTAALHALSTIGYYRLSGYWRTLWVRDASGEVTDRYQPNSTFSTVLELYEFDRLLRLVVLDAIERVEIAARTRISDQLAKKYGAFAHTDSTIFRPNFRHAKWIEGLDKETQRSREQFVLHHQRTYQEFPALPIWVATGVMSLGTLSRLYLGIKPGDRKAVSRQFNTHHMRLGDNLHALTNIRNICAHHGRLWNRNFSVSQHVSGHPHWQPPITPNPGRLFFPLLILNQLLQSLDAGSDWRNQCTDLIKPIAACDPWRKSMGLPEKWEEHPLWKATP